MTGTSGTAIGAPEPAEEGHLHGAPPEKSSRLLLALLLAKLQPIWPWIVLAGLAWLGWREMKQVDLSAVRAMLRATPPGLVIGLLAATALNLAVFGLYDIVALGPLSRGPRAGARWSVGVVSFAWSNFLTIGPLAGPALRLWLYRPLQVDGERARAALGSILAAFSLALLGWCGAAALPLPASADLLPVRIALGVPFTALAGAVFERLRRWRSAPLPLRRWEGRPYLLAAVSSADWLIAWVVFHMALAGTHGAIDATLSLRAFFIGQLIGLLSFVPGGLGSADAFWLITLGGGAGGHDRVLAALLLYRVVYYILPWAFATLLLTGRLVRTGRRTSGAIRTILASYAFICGVVLIASAAVPSLTARAAFLRETVPPALVDITHGLSVILGFLLLVVSRGLARGYRSSLHLALALYLAGALTTFLKGLDFEEAILSLIAAALLLVFHQSFRRPGRLRPPVEFIVSAAVVAIVVFAALGFSSMPDRPSESTVLGSFEHVAHAARFLRGMLLLIGFSAVVAVHYSLRARAHDSLPGQDLIDHAIRDVKDLSRSTNPLLVACGDKAIFRPSGPGGGGRHSEGFIAYRASGRFLVAYSDPVCPPGAERDLLAAFLDHAAEKDRDVVLYQISAAFLPVAHDFGFSFFKLGEEAIVDLTSFDLKGNKAKSWRHAVNSVEKAGGRFEIVEGETLRALMPDLRRVSDAWLRDKEVVEKSFSIGRFDETYLARFPCAVVRDPEGRVTAFANILEGSRREELSIDLMRHRTIQAEGGGALPVMDYLFLKLMVHGKENGFRRFNLGMAPLSAVGEERWARPFERLAHLFFRHGEAWYNYQGLRRYKEKFNPVWEPRYMAYPRPWDWPAAVTATAVLVGGGWRALIGRKEATA